MPRGRKAKKPDAAVTMDQQSHSTHHSELLKSACDIVAEVIVRNALKSLGIAEIFPATVKVTLAPIETAAGTPVTEKCLTQIKTFKRRGRKPGQHAASIHKPSESDAKIAGMRMELSLAKSQGKLTDAQERALDATRNMRVAKMSKEQKAQIIGIYEDFKAGNK